jgi:hypothetical protein
MFDFVGTVLNLAGSVCDTRLENSYFKGLSPGRRYLRCSEDFTAGLSTPEQSLII